MGGALAVVLDVRDGVQRVGLVVGLARVFAHAAVRKVAYVLVGLLAAAVLSGRAEAAVHSAYDGADSLPLSCDTSADNCNIQQAWTACTADQDIARTFSSPWPTATCTVVVGDNLAPSTTGTIRCFITSGGTSYSCRFAANGGSATPAYQNNRDYVWTSACPGGGAWNSSTHTCAAPCASGPPLTTGWTTTTGASVCNGGCAFVPTGSAITASKTIDGITYRSVAGWIPTNEVSCPAGQNDLTTPPPDTDGDGTSDSKDGAPTDPGSDGKGDPPPDDPPDDDGDGEPDCGHAGEPNCPDRDSPGEHTSSGGSTCNDRPTGSGDPLLSNLLFQAWAGRCEGKRTADALAGEGNSGSGGLSISVNTAGLEGKLTSIDGKLGTEGTGGDPDMSEGEDPGSVWQDDSSDPLADLDESGFGLSRTCPEPPTVVIGGITKTIPMDGLCDVAVLLGVLIAMAGGIQAVYILGSGGRS